MEDARTALRTRAPAAVTAVMLAALMAMPAAAQQLYKWVDERGVTNYSNQPPPDPKKAKNVRTVDDRLSVYTPDQGLVQAMEDNERNLDRRLQQRQIRNLENQLEAEQRARQQATAAAQDARTAYEKCIAEGRPDCEAIYGYYPAYPPPVVIVPRHRRPVSQAVLPPGAIAGNVTGDKNFIPGNSASAPPPEIRRNVIRRHSDRSTGKASLERSPSERPLLERR